LTSALNGLRIGATEAKRDPSHR